MSLRDESKKEWIPNAVPANAAEINIGSLQRIADAVEKMSGPYAEMLRQVESYKRLANNAEQENEHLLRRIRSLRGTITRMKEKAR